MFNTVCIILSLSLLKIYVYVQIHCLKSHFSQYWISELAKVCCTYVQIQSLSLWRMLDRGVCCVQRWTVWVFSEVFLLASTPSWGTETLYIVAGGGQEERREGGSARAGLSPLFRLGRGGKQAGIPMWCAAQPFNAQLRQVWHIYIVNMHSQNFYRLLYTKQTGQQATGEAEDAGSWGRQ